jgi:predicted flap endonuclease-1-like 5' DNA nuclease
MATKKQSLTVPVVDKARQDCHCGCAPCDGTCCRLDCIVQPRFFCGQLLTDADLSALLKWARDRFGLSRYRHGWGVVCGLDVRGKYGSPTTLIVTPGYAVDCCGNDIIVCEEASIDLKRVCRDQEDPCADLRREMDLINETPAFGDRLRAVDIYLQYDELSADRVTAMGRGSCKQVSECEYSRTQETYKLTWEIGVAGTDPVRARARRWLEEYEKCLDVLKDFRAQFGASADPEQVRQWLLRWLHEHQEYGLSYVYELIKTASVDFLRQERNLVPVFFAVVQACRNAYLNCGCFGCDEDARLPLARVWLLPDDRAAGQECRVVAVDPYPPYRRPIQPECWPAPLGEVNVGRFIWHRWEEVCTALTDLGLNVERTPFRPPATLRALQDSLTCDLFIPCGQRRFAVVFDPGEIPGLNLQIFGERVIGFCQTPGGGEGPEPEVKCPELRMDHPGEASPGQPIRFAVSLTPPVQNVTYNWTLSAGTITSGQGTPSITVDTTGATGVVTAVAEIQHLDPSCNNKASGSTKLTAQPKPAPAEDDFTQIDQIGPGRATILQNAGIRSFADLANTPIEKLKELFPPPVTEDLLKAWLQKAKELAH